MYGAAAGGAAVTRLSRFPRRRKVIPNEGVLAPARPPHLSDTGRRTRESTTQARQKSYGSRPGRKPARLDDVDGQLEAVTDAVWQVRVAAEGHGRPALLPPPAHQVDGRQGRLRVDFEHPARGGEGAQRHAVLLLEWLFPVQVRALGPVAAREVQVGEDLEQAAALDQGDKLGEVVAHHVVGRHGPEERVGGHEAPVVRDRVQRAEDPVEGVPAHDRARARPEQVRLACLHARQDPQPGEALPALLDRRHVPGDVKRLDPAPPATVGGGIQDRVALAADREL